MIDAKWIRFDEQTNALDYLEKTYLFLQDVENNPTNWKWIILSLHGAIYGFAIAACRGTDSSSVVYTTKSGDKNLISFNVALKKCQDPRWMAPNVDYKYFKLSDKQKKSLKELKDLFRNNFAHFKPKSWSIEIHMLPEILLDCLDVCRLLIVNSDVGWRLRPTKLRSAKSFIYKSKSIISNSQLYKEYLSFK